MTAPFDAAGLAAHAVRRASERTFPPEIAPLESLQLPHLGKGRIPPRQWAYGHYLLCGQTAVLGAVDGGGKGAMAVAVALSVITGRPLLGERVWRTGAVAIISYEDDPDEWHRRIAAACHHYNVDYDLALENIRFIVRPRARIVFAAMGITEATGGMTTVFPDGDDIIAAVTDMGAALLIVDPFNHAHKLDDGNNNAMMARVAAEMDRIAHQSGIAALVLHHLRKGSSGDVDDLMGATSLRATFRSTRILARMTPEEAKALGVKHEAWRYSRISGSKENYAPPPDKATWFRLESVELGNGDAIYPDGDSVAVTTSWTPPGMFDGVGSSEMAQAFELIRQGPEEGHHFSPSRQSKHWVGHPIARAMGKTPDEAAKIVGQLLKNEVLLPDEITNAHRNVVKRVTLNEGKASAMLGGSGFKAGSIDD